ncbi:MAG: hydrogenase expression/formation protein HypE [bacterium]
MSTIQTLDESLDRIEKAHQARQGKFYLRDTAITLSHGSGGKASHNLIEGLIAKRFSNPLLDRMDDSAVLTLNDGESRLAFTTDSYVVSPIFFPGGDIGQLAVHGTINDLAVSGAEPVWLSVGLILEEGLAIDDLERILDSMQHAAETAGVKIVTGDTKVVNRGSADKIFINTAGLGIFKHKLDISSLNARPGDKVLLNGPVGDHGISIMLARETLDMEAEIVSDTAPLNDLIQRVLEATDNVHCLKDATRGGVATTLNEIAVNSHVAIAIEETEIPVRPEVNGACELLGIDPLTVANEGKFVAIVGAEDADKVLDVMRGHALGAEARIIGNVISEPPGMVFLRTQIGGTRVLDMLVGDPLPRIC